MVLSTTQIHHFHTEGYLIVPQFFPGETVIAMRLEMGRLVAEDRGRNVMPPFTGKINYLITPLADKSELFRAIPAWPDVIETVEQLIGAPALLWLEQIFLKPARVGAGNTWHIDNGRFKVLDPTRGLGMWIALHDSSLVNGTLELVPRSHQFPPDSFIPPGQFMPVPPTGAHIVPMVAPAGSTIFFNFGILHCTRDNESAEDRAALVYHFLQADNQPLV